MNGPINPQAIEGHLVASQAEILEKNSGDPRFCELFRKAFDPQAALRYVFSPSQRLRVEVHQVNQEVGREVMELVQKTLPEGKWGLGICTDNPKNIMPFLAELESGTHELTHLDVSTIKVKSDEDEDGVYCVPLLGDSLFRNLTSLTINPDWLDEDANWAEWLPELDRLTICSPVGSGELDCPEELVRMANELPITHLELVGLALNECLDDRDEQDLDSSGVPKVRITNPSLTALRCADITGDCGYELVWRACSAPNLTHVTLENVPYHFGWEGDTAHWNTVTHFRYDPVTDGESEEADLKENWGAVLPNVFGRQQMDSLVLPKHTAPLEQVSAVLKRNPSLQITLGTVTALDEQSVQAQERLTALQVQVRARL